METTAPRRWPISRRTALRVGVLALLALIGFATLSIVAAVTLAREFPHWWRSVDPTDPETIRLAEDVERGVINRLHQRRDDGEVWTVSVTAQQANAWLNAKMPRWVAHQWGPWPSQIAEVQVDFDDRGRVSLGARIAGVRREQIVAATVQPLVAPDGALWLTTATTRAGRLDLPQRWTVSTLWEWLPSDLRNREATERLILALAGEAPALEDASLRLEDGRRVRLVELRPEAGRLLVTCVTERPDNK